MKKLFVVFFMFIFAMITALVSNAQEQQNETNVIEMSKNDVNATVNSSKYENALKKENIRKESDYNFKNIEMNKFNIQLIQPNFYMNKQ
mgnify:FL=1